MLIHTHLRVKEQKPSIFSLLQNRARLQPVCFQHSSRVSSVCEGRLNRTASSPPTVCFVVDFLSCSHPLEFVLCVRFLWTLSSSSPSVLLRTPWPLHFIHYCFTSLPRSLSPSLTFPLIYSMSRRIKLPLPYLHSTHSTGTFSTPILSFWHRLLQRPLTGVRVCIYVCVGLVYFVYLCDWITRMPFPKLR